MLSSRGLILYFRVIHSVERRLSCAKSEVWRDFFSNPSEESICFSYQSAAFVVAEASIYEELNKSFCMFEGD